MVCGATLPNNKHQQTLLFTRDMYIYIWFFSIVVYIQTRFDMTSTLQTQRGRHLDAAFGEATEHRHVSWAILMHLCAPMVRLM